MYSISFTENNKKFCVSLHRNEPNSYLFVNCTKIYSFKATDSEIVAFQKTAASLNSPFFIGLDNFNENEVVKQWSI